MPGGTPLGGEGKVFAAVDLSEPDFTLSSDVSTWSSKQLFVPTEGKLPFGLELPKSLTSKRQECETKDAWHINK